MEPIELLSRHQPHDVGPFLLTHNLPTIGLQLSSTPSTYYYVNLEVPETQEILNVYNLFSDHHLFGNGRYEEAMEHFVASQVELTHTLSLYPGVRCLSGVLHKEETWVYINLRESNTNDHLITNLLMFPGKKLWW